MNRIGAVFCAVALAFTPTASALAATTISFTGGSSALDGTDGNIRAFNSGGITVQASAFSFNVNTLEQAYLGWYSSGLGVTNQGEGNGSSSNRHTIDNVGRSDFIALVFSTAAIGGPVLGGLLVSHMSWRWLFLANVPLAAFACLCLCWV